MRNRIKRLLWAASLSLACFGATSYWYTKTNPNNNSDSTKKPIAFVEKAKDEIHRRPLTRIIWQAINIGDPVYPGEALRTSSQGEVRIQFADNPRFIELEPDSLIVISQSEGKEISLDLMDGGLTVNQGTGQLAANSDVGLKLKSGSTSVDLSQATASLSKTGSQIDLQVLKGTAKINSNGQTKEIESGKAGALDSNGGKFNSAQIQILSPSLVKAHSLNPESPQPVIFAWKGFPEKSVVTLEYGKTRKYLKSGGSSAENQIALQLPAGKYFWKLRAQDPETQKIVGESALYRLEVSNRFPPILISPYANEPVLQKNLNQPVEFRWTRPSESSSILLEVAQDEALKNKVISQKFTTEESFAKPLGEGHYFVRLSASFDNEQKYFSGKIQHFQVTAKAIEPVRIEWLKAENQFLLPQTGQLRVPFEWNSEQKDHVKTWRLKIGESEEQLAESPAQIAETPSPFHQLNFNKTGRYIAMVEAVDDTNTVIAKSPLKTITIELPPLLSAPKLVPETGELRAEPDGSLSLRWTPVDGAKEYSVTMIRPPAEPKSIRLSKTATSMVNLLPGQFEIEVSAIDFYGRESAKEKRTVLVPDTSALATPKVRKIKVK